MQFFQVRLIISLQQMQERIQAALALPAARNAFAVDLGKTFIRLGMDVRQAVSYALHVIDRMQKEADMETLEQEMFQMMSKTMVAGYCLRTLMRAQLAHRAAIMFDEVRCHLERLGTASGKVIDYGCGDGQMGLFLRSTLGLDVEGCDVRDYRSERCRRGMVFRSCDGDSLPVRDGYYDAAVLANVAHHADDNDAVLREVSRVTSRHLIVVETVPDPAQSDSPVQRDLAFLNDYVCNRFFSDADIPVPGTYESIDRWPTRFAEHGWRCLHQQELRVDQRVIQDHHVLFVFSKHDPVARLRDRSRILVAGKLSALRHR